MWFWDLEYNNIGHEGVMNLSKCDNLNNLTTLNLDSYKIGMKSIEIKNLLSKCLKNLKTIST